MDFDPDEVKRKIRAFFGASDDSGGGTKKSSITSPPSWKALMSKISRLQRLRVCEPLIVANLDQGRCRQAAVLDQFFAVAERHHVVGP